MLPVWKEFGKLIQEVLAKFTDLFKIKHSEYVIIFWTYAMKNYILSVNDSFLDSISGSTFMYFCPIHVFIWNETHDLRHVGTNGDNIFHNKMKRSTEKLWSDRTWNKKRHIISFNLAELEKNDMSISAFVNWFYQFYCDCKISYNYVSEKFILFLSFCLLSVRGHFEWVINSKYIVLILSCQISILDIFGTFALGKHDYFLYFST